MKMKNDKPLQNQYVCYNKIVGNQFARVLEPSFITARHVKWCRCFGKETHNTAKNYHITN
jgi:hypothetical protein